MELGTLVNAQKKIEKLISTKLPPVVSYKLGIFYGKIKSELDNFERVRSTRASELGTPELDKDGKETDTKVVQGDNLPIFHKEMGDLLSQKVDIDDSIPEVHIGDLAGLDNVEPTFFIGLEWLIKE